MSRRAIGTMREQTNPPEPFQRAITVIPEIRKIIAALPPLDIREDG